MAAHGFHEKRGGSLMKIERRASRGALAALLLCGTALAPLAAWAQAVNAGEVSANGGYVLPGASTQPTKKQVFHSGQTTRVLGRAILDAAGPVGGAGQVLSYAPGVNVNGYGVSGATKETVTVNGVNQGWTGLNGYNQNGGVSVSLDGVPISDQVTGLWQSPSLPQMKMIQNANVTYGPGNPLDREANTVAGGIEFTPIQPTAKPGGDLNLTYGSFDQKNLEFDLRTGLYDGWSSVLAVGLGSGNSYRTGPDGSDSPNRDEAVYFKTIKHFTSGSFEFGTYYAQSRGFRPPYVPKSANPYITVNGQNAAGAVVPGELYSQATSGYYSTPPFANYNKNDGNTMFLVYGRENIDLDPTTSLHNLTWYQHISRLHSRLADVFALGSQEMEYNDPYTNTFGDKLYLTKKLPFNDISIGGYYIHSLYNSRNNFYNTADGGDQNLVNVGGKIRSGYFQLDNFAAFLQDDIHPIPALHITPGIRLVDYQMNFYSSVLQDFNFAPGTILPPAAGSNVSVQDALPSDHQNRTGIEPSFDINYRPLPWFALFGNYAETWKSPEVGGGGGLFQKVPGQDYQLELGQEYQAGFKINVRHYGLLNNFSAGAAYYHLRYAKQTIPIGLPNGDEVVASGTSLYQGVNMFFDDNPLYNLHVFGNANFESAYYSNYQVNPFGTGAANDYNGYPVSYVPNATLNLGAYYDYPFRSMIVQPRGWVQYIGSQHMYNGINAAPDYASMPSYQTFNLALKVKFPLHIPYAGTRQADVTVTALNILNRHYNSYQYISGGGYFLTTGAPSPYGSGYINAYPGAPFSIYGSLGVHF